MKRHVKTAKPKSHNGTGVHFQESRSFEHRQPDDSLRYHGSSDDAPFADIDDEHDTEGLRGAQEGGTQDAAPEDNANSPDDALGLYLRQMGAIPLLNREQELKLARHLELR